MKLQQFREEIWMRVFTVAFRNRTSLEDDFEEIVEIANTAVMYISMGKQISFSTHKQMCNILNINPKRMCNIFTVHPKSGLFKRIVNKIKIIYKNS